MRNGETRVEKLHDRLPAANDGDGAAVLGHQNAESGREQRSECLEGLRHETRDRRQNGEELVDGTHGVVVDARVQEVERALDDRLDFQVEIRAGLHQREEVVDHDVLHHADALHVRLEEAGHQLHHEGSRVHARNHGDALLLVLLPLCEFYVEAGLHSYGRVAATDEWRCR